MTPVTLTPPMKRTAQTLQGHMEIALKNRVTKQGLWEVDFVASAGWDHP